jgi:threonine dehydratase
MGNIIPAFNDIIYINEIISPYIDRTEIISSTTINGITGSKVLFKCENFQKTGSFKTRGAVNAVLSLKENERKKGIVTHSSGNFAAALSYAASCMGVKAKIVMPENATQSKVEAVNYYGGEIIYTGNKPGDREKTANKIVEQTGASFIHPSNDFRVIQGHSSAAIEFVKQSERLDYVIVPVGGGGLISGIATGFYHLSPDTKIIGAEPENANDAFRSLKEGKIIPSINPDTIADGLRTSLGDITFPIIKQLVEKIITVTEEEIISAMRIIWERMKLIAEPSGCVGLAVLLKEKELFKNKKVGIIISGGNVNLTNLPW